MDGRPTRHIRRPSRYSSDSESLEAEGRSSKGQQQPAGSRKRSADSLASHAIRLSDIDETDDDESYQQESDSESPCEEASDEEPSSKGKTTAKSGRKPGKAVRVVPTKLGPAAVARKGAGLAR